MVETPTQSTALKTLTSNSSNGIISEYTKASSSARLSTIGNILTQRFGSYWKLILILILFLLIITLIIILLF